MTHKARKNETKPKLERRTSMRKVEWRTESRHFVGISVGITQWTPPNPSSSPAPNKQWPGSSGVNTRIFCFSTSGFSTRTWQNGLRFSQYLMKRFAGNNKQRTRNEDDDYTRRWKHGNDYNRPKQRIQYWRGCGNGVRRAAGLRISPCQRRRGYDWAWAKSLTEWGEMKEPTKGDTIQRVIRWHQSNCTD